MVKKEFDELSMDKRIIEKKLRDGKISEAQLQEYLKDLPDLSENAEESIVELEKEKKK